MVLKQGYERFCVQQRTVPYTNPVTKATYNVLQCLNCEADGQCEWEFANNHEWDGTNDGSYWTSIMTDNLLATSPSINGLMQEAPALAATQRPQLKDTDSSVDGDDDDDGDDIDVRRFFGKRTAFRERSHIRNSVHVKEYEDIFQRLQPAKKISYH